MISMDKTTRNNPAAFQKMKSLTFVNLLKKSLKKFLEKGIKISCIFFFTNLLNYLYQFKKKKYFYCNLCKYNSSYFINTSNKTTILMDSICPNCSGRKRHRGLYEEYKKVLKSVNKPIILHFAPEPVFYSLFSNYDYITADLELNDVDYQFNIQNIDCKSNLYDLILCNHVLEHVEDDILALNELERILKPLGQLILTVPGNWNRNEIVTFKELDDNGHYRDYGLNLVIELEKIFNIVEVVDLYKYNNNYNLPLGLTINHDLAFICQKK